MSIAVLVERFVEDFYQTIALPQGIVERLTTDDDPRPANNLDDDFMPKELRSAL